jgi:hypothetical protein
MEWKVLGHRAHYDKGRHTCTGIFMFCSILFCVAYAFICMATMIKQREKTNANKLSNSSVGSHTSRCTSDCPWPRTPSIDAVCTRMLLLMCLCIVYVYLRPTIAQSIQPVPYGLDNRGIMVRLPSTARYLSVLESVKIGSRDQPPFYLIGRPNAGSYHGSKVADA